MHGGLRFRTGRDAAAVNLCCALARCGATSISAAVAHAAAAAVAHAAAAAAAVPHAAAAIPIPAAATAIVPAAATAMVSAAAIAMASATTTILPIPICPTTAIIFAAFVTSSARSL